LAPERLQMGKTAIEITSFVPHRIRRIGTNIFAVLAFSLQITS
jgi:hypothetical protein